jgi:hypothetical protein
VNASLDGGDDDDENDEDDDDDGCQIILTMP